MIKLEKLPVQIFSSEEPLFKLVNANYLNEQKGQELITEFEKDPSAFYWFRSEEVTPQNCLVRFEEEGYTTYVMLLQEKPIGFIYLNPNYYTEEAPETEISRMVGVSYRGQDLARKAMNLLSATVFREYPDMILTQWVEENNTSSIRVHEKFGTPFLRCQQPKGINYRVYGFGKSWWLDHHS